MNAPGGANDVAEGVGAAAAGSAAAATEILRDVSEIPFLLIGVLVLGAWLLVRGLAWVIPKLAEALPARFRVRILPWVPVLRLVVVVMVVIVIVPLVISPTPQNLFAVVGALGIALGFAFKDLISSLVAGVVAVGEQPYRQGDWVRVNGAYGEVRHVGLRSVRLVTPSDDVVTVPHNVLWTDNVYNSNDGERTLMVVTTIFLEPNHDGEVVRERLREVAWTSPWLDVARVVLVHVTEEAWGTRYDVKAYPLDARDQFQFRSDVTVRAKAAMRDLGLSFANVPAATTGEAEASRSLS